MGAFIQNNVVWLVPIASILLTIVVKISAKPEYVTLGYLDYFDFGFDLSITSLVMLLTNVHDAVGIGLLAISFLLVMVTAIIVNRIGWDKDTKQQKPFGIFVADFFGTVLLVIATLYERGVFK